MSADSDKVQVRITGDTSQLIARVGSVIAEIDPWDRLGRVRFLLESLLDGTLSEDLVRQRYAELRAEWDQS